MRKKKKIVERRRHRRFHVQEGALAILGPHPSKIGQVIDIGRGGLAFSYIAGEEPPTELTIVSIMLADKSFYLSRMPFQIVSDQEAGRSPFSSLRMGRCGGRFGELTDPETSQLEYFIQNHTVGEM